ncbi:SHOCT domain-containing protein [Clostridium intestinale]|uniref:SHOCT domain-containing protein n=1 Tax=Clostridium intestinale TaxID=36845 RepID=A0A7D6VT44_9CLOT|nr:SHOCT domain-containing protein [Clostridium intestinale]QLY79170.1 SHOCT domain-containing protein [Clostridium intestinale]
MRKDIDDLIKELKLPTLGFKSNYKCAEEYLMPNEKVLFIYPGNASISAAKQDEKFSPDQLNLKNKKPGIFVITTNRIFHANSIFGGSFEQIEKNEIVSYRVSKVPLIGGTIQIFSNHKSLEIDLSYKKQIVEAAKKSVMSLIESKNSSKVTNVENNLDREVIDIPEQIKKLADLRDVGILSEQEFTQKKRELLERM